MKILVVDPGSPISTGDVYVGLVNALRRKNHDVFLYNLQDRIDMSHAVLGYLYEQSKRTLEHPNMADVYYVASIFILERALRFDVDWVIVISAMYVHPDVLVMLQRAGKKVSLYCTESPYNDREQANIAKIVDIAWVNDRTSVDPLRLANPQTYYLPAGYDATFHNTQEVNRLTRDGEDVAAHDVVFVGTGFPERVDFLRSLDWQGIDFGLYGNWTLLGSRAKLRKHLYKGKLSCVIPNDHTVSLYKQAKINLNLFRTSIGYARQTERIEAESAESLGPRALEIAACGRFMISEYRKEIEEIFGDAVPTFRSAKEAGELIRYFLNHPDEREQMAAVLPRLVRNRSFDAITDQLLDDLAHWTPNRVQPVA